MELSELAKGHGAVRACQRAWSCQGLPKGMELSELAKGHGAVRACQRAWSCQSLPKGMELSELGAPRPQRERMASTRAHTHIHSLNHSLTHTHAHTHAHTHLEDGQRAQLAGEDEVKQGPKLGQAVLDGGPRHHEAVHCLELRPERVGVQLSLDLGQGLGLGLWAAST